jgi:hypothetical protein
MLLGQFFADSMTLPNYYKELPAPVHYQGDDDTVETKVFLFLKLANIDSVG